MCLLLVLVLSGYLQVSINILFALLFKKFASWWTSSFLWVDAGIRPFTIQSIGWKCQIFDISLTAIAIGALRDLKMRHRSLILELLAQGWNFWCELHVIIFRFDADAFILIKTFNCDFIFELAVSIQYAYKMGFFIFKLPLKNRIHLFFGL